MDILHKNLIEYILNPYLDYKEDILKLKQLYEYKFDIGQHLEYRKHPLIKNISFTYLDNRKIKQISLDKNRNKNGEYVYVNDFCYLKRFYYDNGQKSSESNLKNKLQHGKQITWYSNGQMWYECNYKNGQLHGIYKEWSENGKLIKEGNYKNGKILDK
jgi:antitoxin component YwqK of YwqJK toxin-antitoxin module